MTLVIRKSRIHSSGCFTTEAIKKGAFIVEYTGERITVAEADRRYDGKDYTYLFGLQNGKEVIDGNGLAAFINHSCDGNCETEEVDEHVWIVAARNIKAGEELTYDYNLYDGDGHAPCRCGSQDCRGTMYEEKRPVRRRKPAAKRKRPPNAGVNRKRGNAKR